MPSSSSLDRLSARLTTPMLAIASAVIIGGPLLAVGRMAFTPSRPSYSERQALAEAAMPKLDAVALASGRQLYQAACIACHGADGHGVPNLGKDLVASPFVRGLTDADLAAFIAKGRGPGDPGFGGPIPMPARGGRTDFSDAHMAMIATYVRSLQQPSRVPAGPLPEVKLAVLEAPAEPVAAAAGPVGASTPAAAPSAAETLAIGTAPFDAAAAQRGQKVFANCIACHGKTGVGVKGAGADLAHSAFVAAKTDEELIAFVKRGRLPSDPESKLKLAMPAKGGNPALKDAQLADVVHYMRQLQSQAAAKAKS